MHVRGSIVVLGASLLAAVMWAQPATPAQMGSIPDKPEYGTLHLSTRLGSFRTIDGVGRAEFTFSGTVLVSKLKGKVTMSGNVREEYKDEERAVYHGTGRCVVEGEWRAVQWFGRDMNFVWYGKGIARVTGDFDANQETGWYWYDDPTDRMPWPAANSRDVVLPKRGVTDRIPTIRPRSGG
ncbi:MAG: hypothetical protein KF812_03530 [Fimbriimonadaceae bacterium]|nr:hypothetical protein [Fimbriimonadaceae bacterium]MBX3334577.1 hypothetical protein [Nitrospira sp.]